MRDLFRTTVLVIAALFFSPLLFATAAATEAKTAAPSYIISESLDAISQAVGIASQSESETKKRKIKIAMFDIGFKGFAKAVGDTLPASTKLRTGPVAVDPKTEDGHGVKMAELLTGLLDRTDVEYQLHLFQTSGYSNFQAAIDTAIVEKFDIISYSQVWENAENDDGRGFVNELVTRATSKGIIWVNAVGNFGKTTYRTAVERTTDDWARLPGPNDSVQIRCEKNSEGVCRLRLVLAWNSFSRDVNTGTDKDLDLVLTDDTLRVIKVGGLVQKKSVAAGEPGSSLFPREIIEAEVKPGLYFARVKIRSTNFSKADVFRLTLRGDFTEMINRTEGETVFAPADNPDVIAVGASDSALDSVSRKNLRPDFAIPSLIKTSDGGEFKGSSNTAAAVAARVAVELSKQPKQYALSRDSMLQILRGGSARPPQTRPAQPADDFGLESTAPNCYVYQILTVTPRHVRSMLREGGVVVETRTGVKMFIDEEPFTRAARLGLNVSDEGGPPGARILVADATGLFSTSILNRQSLSEGTVEIVRTPVRARFCALR